MSDARKAGYEKTIWQGQRFVYGGLGLIGFLAITFLIVGFLTVSWTHQTWPALAPAPKPETTPGWQLNAPQLQLNANSDLVDLQRREQQRLHTWAESKQEPGYAAIPIEKAMMLLADQQKNPGSNPGLLPVPIPMTPIDLQNQKSKETQPPPPPLP